MTLLKERLSHAGVDTSQARLAALAVIALQENNGSVAAATESLFRKLANEAWIVKEVFLKPYLVARLSDMRGGSESPAAPQALVQRASLGANNRQQSKERKRAITNVVLSAVEAIRFKHLTSDGRDWAIVGAHELSGMARDGNLAAAIRDRLGALSDTQQVKPIGELMTRAVFNEVRASMEDHA